MATFRCTRCKQEYEDYYPTDDTCLKCQKGTIRIVEAQSRASERETKAMESIVERAYRMGIHKDQTVFLVTMGDLLRLVDESMDTEVMTAEELQESIKFIRRALDNLNLYSFVQAGLNSVVIGGSQVKIARAGGYPCEKCPDCFLDTDGSCGNEEFCKAWSIYSSQY